MQTGPDAGAFMCIEGREQGAPEHRLPRLFRRNRQVRAARGDEHIVPVVPGLKPVGAVNLVLIQQIGQATGQLEKSIGLVWPQKPGHRLKARHGQQRGQLLHEAPGQRDLVQR